MILIMCVSLYASRVILDKLGVEDYGLYNVVGSVVGMLSFVTGTLSIGTSRFITYEFGTGDKRKLWLTFNTSFYTHLFLAILVLLLFETIGLWFFYHELVIPEERLDACLWVYQLSLLTTFISIIQIPYTSLIQSHEHFNTYAYVSIFEALAKLGICYLITITIWDKLIIYALLIALIQLFVALYFCYYCNRHFEESNLSIIFDRLIFRQLIGFSGWNIVANLSEMLRVQGVIVIINIFLSPVVVAAQAISNQVSNALMGFVNNFRTALNPQIIKLYAAGERDSSKKLTLQTTVICFDMLLIMALPCIYTMDVIMDIWLVEVPDYAVIFTQFIFISNIIRTFDASFYIPMMAANEIKTNSLAAVIFSFLQYAVLCIALYLGGGALWVPILSLVVGAIFSFIVKPYVLWRYIDYSVSDLSGCYWSCAKVLICSCLTTLPFLCFFEQSVWEALVMIFISVISVGVFSFVFMEKDMRIKLQTVISRKMHSFYVGE